MLNLIRCVNNCIYQKDGYCTLDKPSKITGEAVDGCCYYEQKNGVTAQNIGEKRK